MKTKYLVTKTAHHTMQNYTIKRGHYIIQNAYYILKIARHTMKNVHLIMASVYIMKRYIRNTRYIIENIATPYDGKREPDMTK